MVTPSPDRRRPPDLAPAVSVPLPTPYGRFTAHAFEAPSGWVHVALTLGDVAGGRAVLTRLHSECLTGDVLGSLRCDCGVQLRTALGALSAAGRGVLVYLTGHEGRGIGLVNKLRAYLEQDRGADTVDANLLLGMPADRRRYDEAAAVLRALGVRSVELLTNNPAKAADLRRFGMPVESVRRLATVPHARNAGYLRTKQERLGHLDPRGAGLAEVRGEPLDVSRLLGEVAPRTDRPYVVVKYAQSVDGRIAAAGGDARWISGPAERQVAHALRATCDAVLVGAGTIAQDDPQLTVRLVPGASPMRVVVDSTLRTRPQAHVLDGSAATLLCTTPAADPGRRAALAGAGAAVVELPAGPGGVSLPAVAAHLRAAGVATLLVEGGSRVVTGLLAAGLVDRLVVSVSPVLLGAGVEAVGPLGVTRPADGVRLANRFMTTAGDDVLLAWDVVGPAGQHGAAGHPSRVDGSSSA